jgi:ribonuclease HI
MELTAALMALRTLKKPCRVVLHTDSRYLRDAFEEGWLERWQRNGWETADRKPVLNTDLWRELLKLARVHDITFVWVKAHAHNRENNRCDELASLAREKLQERGHARA